MLAEDNLLKFYSTHLSNHLKKITQPLDQCFGLNGFFYTMTTPEGYGFQITNCPDVGHSYFSNGLYKENPFICHPDNYHHDQVLITSDYYDEAHFVNYYDSIKQIQNSFGFENYLVIYKKEGERVHVFMYSTSHKNLHVNTTFSNHLPALKRYSDYFMHEWSNYSKHMDPYMINFGELMGNLYFQFNDKFAVNENRLEIMRLMKQMGLLDNLTNLKFTERELDCIEHFLKGKPASLIAESLGISSRTVEHYLDNIKTKLNCFTKSELYELLQELKVFKLI